AARFRDERIERAARRLTTELGTIAPLELLPPLGIVREPVTECIARRDVFQPFIDCRRFAAHTARPQPINQHPLPIRRARRVVSALDSTHSPLNLPYETSMRGRNPARRRPRCRGRRPTRGTR